jgi:hypothetical protein
VSGLKKAAHPINRLKRIVESLTDGDDSKTYFESPPPVLRCYLAVIPASLRREALSAGHAWLPNG